MTLAHVHLLLNHVPTIGSAIALGLLILSFFRPGHEVRRVSLEVFFIVALLTIPAYLSGVAAQQSLLGRTDIAKPFVDAHEDAAILAFVLMQLGGAFAWVALWQFRRTGRAASGVMIGVLLTAVLAFAVSARAANLGGEIRHPEILVDAVPPGDAALETDPFFINVVAMGRFVTDRTWVWPTCEALHFVGLWLIFGIILIVNLRMMGFLRGIAYADVHRLLPWAALGFGVNAITGMMFVTATPDQYASNISFLWKIIFLMIAGLNLLYATVFEGPWQVEAGAQSPFRVKLAGASAIVAWVGVMYFGRMLPFLGNSF